MNAKTTKFLAVFAVLAMAFAGVAVMQNSEDSTAASTNSEWNFGEYDTEDSAYTEKATITVGKDIYTPTDGQTLEAKKVYYVTEDMTLYIPLAAGPGNPILIFLKEGVEVMTYVPETTKTVKEFDIAYAIIGVTETTDDDGNLVLKTRDVLTDTNYLRAWTASTFDYGTDDKAGIGYPTTCIDTKGTARIWADEKDAGASFGFMEMEDENGDIQTFRSYSNTTLNIDNGTDINGNLYFFDQVYDVVDHAIVTPVALNFIETDGKITTNDGAVIQLVDFTGQITITGGNASITGWTAGDLVVSKGTVAKMVTLPIPTELDATASIPLGSSITFKQGVQISDWTAFHQRYVSDNYAVKLTTVDAGVNGITLTVGDNGFELSGSIIGKAGSKVEFLGAGYMTGTVDMEASGNEAILNVTGDGIHDVTVGSLTVLSHVSAEATSDVKGTGIEFPNGASIADDAVVTVKGTLTVGDDTGGQRLYVGDGAYLRVQGELKLGNNDGKVKMYTAGEVVVDSLPTTSATATTEVTDCTNFVFVYKDGSLTAKNLKITKVGAANMAYVDLTGKGYLAINDTKFAEGNTYYKYAFTAFYAVAVQDVLTLAADSRLIEGIQVDADVTSSEVNYKQLYAKYKINYETKTPTFYIEYIETYEVEFVAKDTSKPVTPGTDFDITDSNGDEVFIDSTGKAKLAYGETYDLNGLDDEKKFKYTSNVKAQKIKYTAPILSTFEQIRSAQTIEVAVGNAIEITVKIGTNTDSIINDGDVVLEYIATDEKESTEVAVEGRELTATFTVYDIDKVLAKLVKKEFFTVTKTLETTLAEVTTLTEKEKDAGWEFAFTDGEQNPADATRTITINYDLAAAVDATGEEITEGVQVILNDSITNDIVVTLEFENYYQGRSGHDQTVELVFEKDTYVTEYNLYKPVYDRGFNFYLGETYTMSWEEKSGIKYVMTYPDSTSETGESTYTMGDLVKVADHNGDESGIAGTIYTLELTKIRYADVVNKTNMDLTLTYGDGTVTVPKGQTYVDEQGLPLDASWWTVDSTTKQKTRITGSDVGYTDHKLELSIKGYSISSWAGTYKDKDSADQTIVGSGPSSTTELVGLVENGVVTINSVLATQNLYQVMVDDQQRPYVGDDYTRTGHYNDTMYLFPTADPGYTVYGIEVYLADPENPGQPGEFYCLATESEDKSVSTYKMPDSDVVLKVIVDKSTYDVTFVDQNGVQIGDKVPVEPYSAHTLEIPAQFGYVATAAVADVEIEGGLGFDKETQTVNFEMPASNVVITVTYDEGGPFSEEMELFVSKTTDGVKITIIANDDLPIQSGYITIDYWYVYEEDGIYGMEQVVLDPIEFATSGTGVIESTTISLAEEEFFGSIYYVSATFEPLDGDAMKSDYIAYQMA